MNLDPGLASSVFLGFSSVNAPVFSNSPVRSLVASDRFSVVTSVPISFSGSDPIISSTPSSSLVDSNLSDNRFYFLYFASSESVAEASGDVSFSVLRQFRCGLSSKLALLCFISRVLVVWLLTYHLLSPSCGELLAR